MAEAYVEKNDDATTQHVHPVERDKNASTKGDKNTVVKSANSKCTIHGGYEHEAPIKNSDVPTKIKNEGEMDNDKSKTDLGVRKPSALSAKDAEKEIARLKISLGEKELENSSLTGDMKDLKKVLGAKDEIVLDLQKKITDLEAKNLSMTNQQREFEGKHKKSVEEVEKLKKEKERDKEQLAEYARQSIELRSQIEEYEREKRSSQLQIEEMGAELRDKDRQLSLLRRAFATSLTSNMAEENEILGHENYELRDQIEALETQVASLQDQSEFRRVDLEEERQAKRRHERLNRVLLEKLRVERMEREHLRRLVENAHAGLHVVHPIIPDAEADELLQEAGRAQAVNGVARMMVENALGGLQVVNPNLPDEEHSNNDL